MQTIGYNCKALDRTEFCGQCGVLWLRSKLRLGPDGILRCPVHKGRTKFECEQDNARVTTGIERYQPKARE